MEATPTAQPNGLVDFNVGFFFVFPPFSWSQVYARKYIRYVWWESVRENKKKIKRKSKIK